jgi:hypothetical protein
MRARVPLVASPNEKRQHGSRRHHFYRMPLRRFISRSQDLHNLRRLPASGLPQMRTRFRGSSAGIGGETIPRSRDASPGQRGIPARRRIDPQRISSLEFPSWRPASLRAANFMRSPIRSCILLLLVHDARSFISTAGQNRSVGSGKRICGGRIRHEARYEDLPG